jgi:hypothetical protein
VAVDTIAHNIFYGCLGVFYGRLGDFDQHSSVGLHRKRARLCEYRYCWSRNGEDLGGAASLLNLSVRNSGRETAFMEEAVISYQLGALPPEPHYARGDIKFVGPVPPGETFAGAFTPLRDGSTMKFDASEMALVNSGKNLFFFGYARYRDPFSPLLGTRMIGFCRQYNPNNPPGLVVFEGCGAVGAKYVYLRP